MQEQEQLSSKRSIGVGVSIDLQSARECNLVFDDLKAVRIKGENGWIVNSLYTRVKLDLEKLAKFEVSDDTLRDIGELVLARLRAQLLVRGKLRNPE